MSSEAGKISRRGFTKFLVTVPIGAAIFDGLSVVSAQPQVPQRATSGPSPSGLDQSRWNLTYGAYYGGDSWSAPIAISYVTGYTVRGSWRRKIGLRNDSANTVRSVGLGAYIINEDKPSDVIATLPLTINLKDGLASGAGCDLDGKDELESSLRSFIKNGVLEGHYRIEVFVSEVVNGDGTVWRHDSKAK